MPQLETLGIGFSHPVPNHDVERVERQLMHTPITTQVTLPNLHRFLFRGVTAYLEALVRRIIAPSLEKLEILFFEHLTFFRPTPPAVYVHNREPQVQLWQAPVL